MQDSKVAEVWKVNQNGTLSLAFSTCHIVYALTIQKLKSSLKIRKRTWSKYFSLFLPEEIHVELIK